MDIGLLHTHVFFCILYIILLIIKFILLVSKRHTQLDKFNQKTKIIHIVLASVMLLTGIVLVVRAPNAFDTWAIVKYIVILLAIGLGIIGVKKLHPGFLGLSILAFVYIWLISKAKCPMLHNTQHQIAEHLQEATQQTPQEQGMLIYQVACVRCHGKAGDAQYRKAPNLKTAILSPEAIQIIVKNGKNTMPEHSYLSDTELNNLSTYVLSLKKE